jgi:hypothetical protein
MNFHHHGSLRFAPITIAYLFLFALSAFAQTAPDKTVKPIAEKPPNQTSADENFQLNISQERITETNFARSTNVELSNSNRGGLRVEVGVGVRAESIDVVLRGIFGNVRFRGSLEILRQRVEQLPLTPAPKPNP